MINRARILVSAVAISLAAGGARDATGWQQAGDAEPPGKRAQAPNVQPAFAPTHVLVKTRQGVALDVDEHGRWSFVGGDDALASDALRNLFAQRGVLAISPAITVTPADAALRQSIGLDRWHMVHVPDRTDVVAFAAELAAFNSLLEHAEPDAIGTLAETNPNDTNFGVQYALKNTGQSVLGQAGTPGADVKATFAWDISTGSSDVVIGVLDAGADEHDDLAGAFIPGWNTYENDGDTSAICGSHGTHVSGIAAARGNNGIGIAGMNWQVKIMPVIILSDACQGTASDCADGIFWAADNGADIISMSLQYYILDEESEAQVQLLHDAVIYARGLGITVIAAAGNNRPVVAYPGAFPETICVAATNNLDQKASFSNPGPELTIAAPGASIYSTMGTSSYGYLSGTSMATPLVSGLAALMMDVDPAITHDQIQSILINTADDVDAPGFDNNTGHGRVNAHAALQETDRLLADLDGNGIVDVWDLLLVLGNWGNCPLSGASCDGDTNGDGVVDVQDLLRVLGGWG